MGEIRPLTAELAALECLKNIPSDVSMLACSILIESSSKLLVPETRTCKSLKGFDLSTFRLLTLELLGPEKAIAFLLANYSKYLDIRLYLLALRRTSDVVLCVACFCVGFSAVFIFHLIFS